MSDLQAFRLADGPCAGEIAELPPEGWETWRYITGSDAYALYVRDGSVFRFAGATKTMQELADHAREYDEVRVHGDSREYER